MRRRLVLGDVQAGARSQLLPVRVGRAALQAAHLQHQGLPGAGGASVHAGSAPPASLLLQLALWLLTVQGCHLAVRLLGARSCLGEGWGVKGCGGHGTALSNAPETPPSSSQDPKPTPSPSAKAHLTCPAVPGPGPVHMGPRPPGPWGVGSCGPQGDTRCCEQEL